MKNGISKAIDKLKEYYSKTDFSSLYTIATSIYQFISMICICYKFRLYVNTLLSLVLDPRFKLSYYKEQKWEKRFINAAQHKIKEIFRLKYASNDTEVNTNDLESDEEEFAMDIFKQRSFVKADELDEYLKAPTASRKTNVLSWWKVSSYFW
jgi:hypothetical protein